MHSETFNSLTNPSIYSFLNYTLIIHISLKIDRSFCLHYMSDEKDTDFTLKISRKTSSNLKSPKRSASKNRSNYLSTLSSSSSISNNDEPSNLPVSPRVTEASIGNSTSNPKVKEDTAIKAIKLSTSNRNAKELETLYKENKGLEVFNFRGGSTPLIEAVIANQVEIVKVLISVGVNIDYIGSKEVYCALYQALNQESEEAVQIVKLLVEAGANIHLKMKSGITCLDWARIARKEGPTHAEMFTILQLANEDFYKNLIGVNPNSSDMELTSLDVSQHIIEESLRKFLCHFKLDQYLQLLYNNYGITSIKHFVEPDFTWQPCALGPDQYWAINMDELYLEECIHKLTISSTIQKEIGISSLDVIILKRNLKRKLKVREKEERKRLGFLFMMYRRTSCRIFSC